MTLELRRTVILLLTNMLALSALIPGAAFGGVCDYLSDNESQPAGTHWSSATGFNVGDFMFSEAGIPITGQQFLDGSGNFQFTGSEIVIDPYGCFYNLAMNFNRISAEYDISALGVCVEGVSFDFTEPAGRMNLQVNGQNLYSGDVLSIPTTIAPGVTATVTVSSYAPVCGSVKLTGPVDTLLIGGENFFIDNLCVSECSDCDFIVDYETQASGAEWDYNSNIPGDHIFVENGIDVFLTNYYSGTNPSFYAAEVSVAPFGCLSSNSLRLANIATIHDFSPLSINTASVSFDYWSSPSPNNLTVNGLTANMYQGDFATAAGHNFGPGISYSVQTSPSGNGATCGTVTLTGNIQSITIGGEEMWIDNVCVIEAPLCPISSDNESVAVGSSWGSPYSYMYTESGIDLYSAMHPQVPFNSVDVSLAPHGFLTNNTVHTFESAVSYDIASAVSHTDSVSFEFTNILDSPYMSVNGIDHINFFNLNGQVVAPNVTCNVSYTVHSTHLTGTVVLIGDVNSLILGGRDIYFDNLCVTEGTPPPPPQCDIGSDNETQTVGSSWSAGSWPRPWSFMFTESSILTFAQSGTTEITAAQYGCLYGNSLHAENSSFIYAVQPAVPVTQSVTFDYYNVGTSVKIRVNGSTNHIAADYSALNGTYLISSGPTTQWVHCTVSSSSTGGTNCGTVTLTGADINSLILGGEDVFFDNLCITPRGPYPPEPPLPVTFRMRTSGSWGSDYGHEPGSRILEEEGMTMDINSFIGSDGAVYGNCFTEEATPEYGVTDELVMFVDHVNLNVDVGAALADDQEVESVRIELVDWGGIENLSVNGSEMFVGDLSDLPTQLTEGVICQVDMWPVIDEGPLVGYLTIMGDVRTFSIGGQELGVDNIEVTLVGSGTTGVAVPTGPSKLELMPNYPNPFNPSTTLMYSLTNDDYVRLTIHDVSGKLVTTLVNSVMPAGTNQVVWNGKNQNGQSVSTGLYFVRVETNSEVQTQKIALIK